MQALQNLACVYGLQALQKKIGTWFGACKAQALHIGDFPYVLGGILFYPEIAFFVKNAKKVHKVHVVYKFYICIVFLAHHKYQIF